MKHVFEIPYTEEDRIKEIIEKIENDTIRGWHLLNTFLLRSRTYDDIHIGRVSKLAKHLVTDAQRQKLHDFELTIRTMGVGEPAIDFSGLTPDGKEMKLSDFKGKVVLVDVWATWCGPCKVEIPHLKKLEQEMHGKDVAVISYSVDRLRDHEKWKKFITDEQLGGVHLFAPADFSSPVCKDYKITGIPRFMLFDKSGKIISIDSPRPSNPELKTLIEKYL